MFWLSKRGIFSAGDEPNKNIVLFDFAIPISGAVVANPDTNNRD